MVAGRSGLTQKPSNSERAYPVHCGQRASQPPDAGPGLRLSA